MDRRGKQPRADPRVRPREPKGPACIRRTGRGQAPRLFWLDNDTILYTASVSVDDRWNKFVWEAFRVFAGDVATGQSLLLLWKGREHSVNGVSLVQTRLRKPHVVLMAAAEAFRAGSTLFEVDVRTGQGTPVDHGPPATIGWVADENGNVLARSEWVQAAGEYQILAKRGTGWQQIYHRASRRIPQLFGATADGKAVMAMGEDTDGRSKLMTLPLDGSAMHVLFEDPDRPVVGANIDRLDGTLLGVMLGGAQPETVWLSPEAARRHQKLAAAFPGHEVELYGRSADNQKMLARVSSPEQPAVYHLVDYATHRADIVADEYPQLQDVTLGTVSAITYKARDGLEIPAYLTLPPATAVSGPRATVVLPHGGPHARDSFEFDWLAQFLASRGYVVLQPQFRGSSGFGSAFEKAGNHQWGGLMQDDVTDGVKALIDQGIADPKRICIVGASYGGYAALAGAAFTPELYACAVSVAGVSDLPMFITYTLRHPESGTAAYSDLQVQIGQPLDAQVVARSPARVAYAVKAPVLLIHGADDSVVPFEQTELMAFGLRKAGRPVTVIKLPGEDHWLSRTETRTRVLTELDSFLKAHLAN
jgi:dipeptidyl aminopeptidase/acylaminoacyl peptidase